MMQIIVGENLRQLKRELEFHLKREMTYTEIGEGVAAALNLDKPISKQAISNWFNDQSNVRSDFIAGLCIYLSKMLDRDVTPNEIIKWRSND